MVHSLLNVKTAVDYIPFQELELRQMLADMVRTPDKYHDHVRRYSTSLVTSFTFGWRSLAFDHPDVKQIYEVRKNLPFAAVVIQRNRPIRECVGLRRICSCFKYFCLHDGLLSSPSKATRLVEPDNEERKAVA